MERLLDFAEKIVKKETVDSSYMYGPEYNFWFSLTIVGFIDYIVSPTYPNRYWWQPRHHFEYIELILTHQRGNSISDYSIIINHMYLALNVICDFL